jgi:hypothetical protein
MLFYNKLFYLIMSGVRDNWDYKVTISQGKPLIDKRDNVTPPIPRIIGMSNDEVITMIEGRGIETNWTSHYTNVTNGPSSTYYIYGTHPNIKDFKDFYDNGDFEMSRSGDSVIGEADTFKTPSKMTPDVGVGFGGSRRRRPSRKYKKSKRVLRRKSRSTRRR